MPSMRILAAVLAAGSSERRSAASGTARTAPRTSAPKVMPRVWPMPEESSASSSISAPPDSGQEGLGALAGRVQHDLFGRALFHDGAVGHKDHPVRHVFGEVHLVGDH